MTSRHRESTPASVLSNFGVARRSLWRRRLEVAVFSAWGRAPSAAAALGTRGWGPTRHNL
jgi:hypothetical protein